MAGAATKNTELTRAAPVAGNVTFAGKAITLHGGMSTSYAPTSFKDQKRFAARGPAADQVTATAWRTDLTSGNVLDLNGRTLTIEGNLIHSGGELKLNGGRLIGKGDYRLQMQRYLKHVYSIFLLFPVKESPVIKAKVVVVATLTAILILVATVVLPAGAATVNDGFDPDVNEQIISTTVQGDGKIVIGGLFTAVGGVTRNHIARLNSDGTLDTTFDPNTNDRVTSIAIQADGKILIGGGFTSVNGVTLSSIARLNVDGSLDKSFICPHVDNMVNSIEIQLDGKVVIGGGFTTIGGITRNYIARLNLDGTLDPTFTPNANLTVVTTLTQPDGRLLIGGSFTSIGGTTRNGIARLNMDGSLDSSFNPNVIGSVYKIAIQTNGKILLGGLFGTVSGVTRNCFARLNSDGSLDSSFNPNMNFSVYSIVSQSDGKIIAGGAFSTVGGAAHTKIVRLNYEGSVDPSFNSNLNYDGSGLSIAVQTDGKIIIGGNFTTVGGLTRNHIARLNADGSLEVSFIAGGINNGANALAVQPDGKILIGNWYGIRRYNLDGTTDSTFNNTLSRDFTISVDSIAVQTDGKIVIGGYFTKVNGVIRENLARLNADGSTDASFDAKVAGSVNSIDIQPDGKIVFVGYFSAVGGINRPGIARVNLDGTLDASFNPVTSGGYSVAVQADGKILVGHGRLNPDGTRDTSFQTTSSCDPFVLQADGKIVCGRYRLNPDGSLDGSFNATISSSTYSIVVQTNGKILTSGVRFNPDGSLDNSFAKIGNSENSTLLQADGRVVIGGLMNGMNVTRWPNNEAATQSLAVSSDGTFVTWLRGGSSPEIENVTFEKSTDMLNWTCLGKGLRINGGWQLTGLSIPLRQNIYIRARGVSKGGWLSGSSSLLESVKLDYPRPDLADTELAGGKAFRDSLLLTNVPPAESGIGRLVKYQNENYETVLGLLDGLASIEASLGNARDIYAYRAYIGEPGAKEKLLDSIKTLANIYLMIGDEFFIDALEFRFSSNTLGADKKLDEQLALLNRANDYYQKAVSTFVNGFLPSSIGYLSDYFDDATLALFNLASERMSAALREKSSKQFVRLMAPDPNQEWATARLAAVQTLKDGSTGTYLAAAITADKAVKNGVNFAANGGDTLITTLSALRKQGNLLSDGNLNPLGYDKRHVPMYEFDALATEAQKYINDAGAAELKFNEANRLMDSDVNAMRQELNSLIGSYTTTLFSLTGCPSPSNPADPDLVLDYSFCVLPAGGDLLDCDVNANLSDFSSCMATKSTTQALAAKYQNLMSAQLRLNQARLNRQNILSQIKNEADLHQSLVTIKRSSADQQSLLLEQYYNRLKDAGTEMDTVEVVTTTICDKNGRHCQDTTKTKSHTTSESFMLNAGELRVTTDKEKEQLAATTEFQIQMDDLEYANKIKNLLLNEAAAESDIQIAAQQKNVAVADFDNAMAEKDQYWNLFKRAVTQITDYYNSRIPTQRVLKSQAAIDLSEALNRAAHSTYLAAKALEYKYVSPIENQYIPGGTLNISDLFKAQSSTDLQNFYNGLTSLNVLKCPFGSTSSQYNVISVSRNILGVSNSASSAVKKAAMKDFLDHHKTPDGREFGFTLSSFNTFLLNPGKANMKIWGGNPPTTCADFSNPVKGITVIIQTDQLTEAYPLYSLSLSGHSTLTDAQKNIFDFIPAYSYQFMLNPETDNPKIISEEQYAFINANAVSPTGPGAWTNAFKARSLASSGWSLRLVDRQNLVDFDAIKDIQIHIDTVSQ